MWLSFVTIATSWGADIKSSKGAPIATTTHFIIGCCVGLAWVSTFHLHFPVSIFIKAVNAFRDGGDKDIELYSSHERGVTLSLLLRREISFTCNLVIDRSLLIHMLIFSPLNRGLQSVLNYRWKVRTKSIKFHQKDWKEWVWIFLKLMVST